MAIGRGKRLQLINTPSHSMITRITRIHPCRHNCHGWPSPGERSLKLINTPSHSPNVAKPRLALILISLIFLSLSLVPSYALYFLITVLYMHHNPWITDLSFCSQLLTTPNSHPQSHTTLFVYEITPKPHHSHCIQISSQFTLSYIIYNYTLLWKPINQSRPVNGRGRR